MQQLRWSTLPAEVFAGGFVGETELGNKSWLGFAAVPELEPPVTLVCLTAPYSSKQTWRIGEFPWLTLMKSWLAQFEMRGYTPTARGHGHAIMLKSKGPGAFAPPSSGTACASTTHGRCRRHAKPARRNFDRERTTKGGAAGGCIGTHGVVPGDALASRQQFLDLARPRGIEPLFSP